MGCCCVMLHRISCSVSHNPAHSIGIRQQSQVAYLPVLETLSTQYGGDLSVFTSGAHVLLLLQGSSVHGGALLFVLVRLVSHQRSYDGVSVIHRAGLLVSSPTECS